MKRTDVFDGIFYIGLFLFIALAVGGLVATALESFQKFGHDKEMREWHNFTVRQGLAEYVPGENGTIMWRWTYSEVASSELPN